MITDENWETSVRTLRAEVNEDEEDEGSSDEDMEDVNDVIDTELRADDEDAINDKKQHRM